MITKKSILSIQQRIAKPSLPLLALINKIMTIVLFFCIFLSPSTIIHTQQKNNTPEFQWPIQKGTYPDLQGITSTFAESRTDHFHNGVDISSHNQSIKPVYSGRVLYSRQFADDPWNVVPGPGNYIIINHTSGWVSGYYHLKNNAKMIRSGIVDKNSTIAKSGNSGHSVGAHLHFFIADKFGKRIQNPLLFLPQTTDAHAPIIGQLILRTTKGETRINHSKKENIKLTKPWPFLVTIIDPGLEKNSRRGIYKLSWTLNKQKNVSKVFNTLEMNGNEWLLENKYDFKSTFKYNYYNLGALNIQQGRNLLHLSASDFFGNTTTVQYEININKEY